MGKFPRKFPLEVKPQGLYCSAGDFFIDASRPVPLCIVTHGHGDHARFGHKQYIAANDSLEILQHRLGENVPVQAISYNHKIKLGECWVSLHPAGHILGSAQIKIETSQGVFVISGDYKTATDATCQPFEPIECDVFVTESTFGLPVYHWENNDTIGKEIYDWWQENSAQGFPSVLFCYALGKAQRILSLLASYSDQPVYLHGAILPLAQVYAQKGISMIPFLPIPEKSKVQSFSKDLILAPPSAIGTPWLKRFPLHRNGAASGWMQVRGMRRRRSLDRGFVLSDHADWDGLIQTIEQTKASKVLTAHGYSDILAKYLREERGIEARELKGLESSDEGEG